MLLPAPRTSSSRGGANVSREQGSRAAVVEEVLNKRNLTLIDELFAPTFIDHDSSMPQAKGPAGVKRLDAIVHTSFPDRHFTIEDMGG